MNFERGAQRIVLVLSIGVLCAGLGLVAQAVWQKAEERAEQARFMAEQRAFAEMEAACRRLGLVLRREAGVTPLLPPDRRCRPRTRDDIPPELLQPDFSDLMAPAPDRGPLATWVVWLGHPTLWGPFATAVLGALVSAGLAALPWGVFYLVRWIVRGFRGKT